MVKLPVWSLGFSLSSSPPQARGRRRSDLAYRLCMDDCSAEPRAHRRSSSSTGQSTSLCPPISSEWNGGNPCIDIATNTPYSRPKARIWQLSLRPSSCRCLSCSWYSYGFSEAATAAISAHFAQHSDRTLPQEGCNTGESMLNVCLFRAN